MSTQPCWQKMHKLKVNYIKNVCKNLHNLMFLNEMELCVAINGVFSV